MTANASITGPAKKHPYSYLLSFGKGESSIVLFIWFKSKAPLLASFGVSLCVLFASEGFWEQNTAYNLTAEIPFWKKKKLELIHLHWTGKSRLLYIIWHSFYFDLQPVNAGSYLILMLAKGKE